MKQLGFKPRGGIAKRDFLRIGSLLVFFACCNFVFGYFANIAYPNYTIQVILCALLGVIWAQAGLLSAGVTLFQSPLWLRLSLYWFLAYLLTAAVLAGIAVADTEAITIWDVLATMLTLPILACAIQAPLWAMKSFFYWRIIGDRIADDPSKISLRVANLFVATAVLAISLGAARLASNDNPSYGTELAIALPTTTLLSLLSVMPAIFLLLRIGSLRFGLFAWTGFTIASSVLLIFSATVLLWQSDRQAFDLFEAVKGSMLGIGLICSSAFALTCGLLALRSSGFRLRIGRPAATSARPSIDEASAAPPME